MKLLKITTFLLLVLCKSLTAQTVDVTWGKEQKAEKSQYVSDLIYSDETGYVYMVSSGFGLFEKSKIEIVKHDLEHQKIYRKVIKLERNGKDYSFSGIRKLKDHMVLFASLIDKKADKNYFYAAKIDLEGNQGDFELIDEINTLKNKGASFSVEASGVDGKFLLVRLNPYDKKGSEKFTYKVFDQNFKLIWEKDIDLEYKDKEFEVKDYEIDGAGNVFLLGRISAKVKREELYTYKIYSYSVKSDKLNEIPLDFKRIYAVHELNMFIQGNFLQITGFYAKDKKSGMNGVLMYKVNCATLEIENEKNIPFNKQDIAKLQSKREQKKNKGISPTYEIRHIFVKDDGTYTILAEQYYVRVVTTTDNRGFTRTTYYYYYNNILAINVTGAGEISWFTILPKVQVSTNDGGVYSSFIATNRAGNIYLLYNSNPKNTSPKKKNPDKVYPSNMNKAQKAVAVLATINDKGELSQEELFKSRSKDKKSKAILRPKFFADLKTGETLLLAVYGKSYKFGMLNIKP